MRVLTVLLALAAAGCYSPGVEDCQFRCGPGGACPDGTSCMGGFCRSGTGACPLASAACRAAPDPPANCSQKDSLDGDTACVVLCSDQRSWTEARTDCAAAGWELGVLDTAAKLAAVPSLTDRVWVGASRATSSSPWMWVNGTPVASEAWSNGTPGSGTGEDCALLGGITRKLSNIVACTETERFMCTYPP